MHFFKILVLNCTLVISLRISSEHIPFIFCDEFPESPRTIRSFRPYLGTWLEFNGFVNHIDDAFISPFFFWSPLAMLLSHDIDCDINLLFLACESNIFYVQPAKWIKRKLGDIFLPIKQSPEEGFSPYNMTWLTQYFIIILLLFQPMCVFVFMEKCNWKRSRGDQRTVHLINQGIQSSIVIWS